MHTTVELDKRAAGPSVAWLCAGFVLAGMGTVLLGPILPRLASMWHLQDADAGLLLAAKFTGAFVGGATVPRRLRLGILLGMMLGCVGFGAFAFCEGPKTAAVALFVCGVGLGQVIASTNILAGQRYRVRTGSALAAINFFWSAGAVVTGVAVAALVPGFGLRGFLLGFAGLFAVVGLGGLMGTVQRGDGVAAGDAERVLPVREVVAFGAMLFLYGGLETSVTQWITTFSARYAVGGVGAMSSIVVLWTALTVGRALTSGLLRWVRETVLQRVALVCSVVMIAVLARCSSGWAVAVAAVLLGLSLAPFFPTTFALLLRKRPPARTAGLILAVSGLGAAGFSWLVGQVSTWTGSLRVAMVVPLGAAVGLLVMSFVVGRMRADEAGFAEGAGR